jgi:hypothetical protein
MKKTIFLVYVEYSNGWEPYHHLKEYAFCSKKIDAIEIEKLLNKLTNEQVHKLKILDGISDDFVKAHVVPRTIDNHENIINKLKRADGQTGT